MNNNLIGEQITQYRKALNMTQEELGKAVGVSTQAVSRWENGGAPDVALLPAVADKLGVTIDALFGREGGEKVDIHDTVARWLAGMPIKDRFDQFCRLSWTVAKNMVAGRSVFPDMGYMEKCELKDEKSGDCVLATSMVWLDGGIMLNLHSDEMSFASVWPMPEAGYEAFFAPGDDYRRLFAALARPGCLETLEYLHSRTCRMYVPGTIAKAVETPVEEIAAILNELAELKVLKKTDLQLEDGMTQAYGLFNGVELVPFLYLARCMMQYGQYLVKINMEGGSQRPLLEGAKWKDGKETKNEKK